MARKDLTLTPELALAAGMLYVVAADGHLTEAERNDLAKVIPNDKLLDRGLDYCRRVPTTDFATACVALLDEDQRLCLMLNMVDAAMADGNIADEERELLANFQDAFGITADTLAPHLRTLACKNDRRRFRA